MPQPGFFDLDERYARLNERDPLVKLNPIIDWEALNPVRALRSAVSLAGLSRPKGSNH